MTIPNDRTESFAVERGFLVMRVSPRRGEPYEHRCPLAAFEAVAHAADEIGQDGFTLNDLKDRADAPWTQANVAFAFLKERGVVVPVHGRRHVPASGGVHLDAMVEYHALREKLSRRLWAVISELGDEVVGLVLDLPHAVPGVVLVLVVPPSSMRLPAASWTIVYKVVVGEPVPLPQKTVRAVCSLASLKVTLDHPPDESIGST